MPTNPPDAAERTLREKVQATVTDALTDWAQELLSDREAALAAMREQVERAESDGLEKERYWRDRCLASEDVADNLKRQLAAAEAQVAGAGREAGIATLLRVEEDVQLHWRGMTVPRNYIASRAAQWFSPTPPTPERKSVTIGGARFEYDQGSGEPWVSFDKDGRYTWTYVIGALAGCSVNPTATEYAALLALAGGTE